MYPLYAAGCIWRSLPIGAESGHPKPMLCPAINAEASAVISGWCRRQTPILGEHRRRLSRIHRYAVVLPDAGHERRGETISCTRFKPLASPDKSF